DFLGVSEANLGVNKANYFIKREVHQDVTIEDNGTVKSQVTLVYINKSDSWPGGDYKNYLRLIVPLGSQLESISIDGVVQTITPAVTDPFLFEGKNFSPPKG